MKCRVKFKEGALVKYAQDFRFGILSELPSDRWFTATTNKEGTQARLTAWGFGLIAGKGSYGSGAIYVPTGASQEGVDRE